MKEDDRLTWLSRWLEHSGGFLIVRMRERNGLRVADHNGYRCLFVHIGESLADAIDAARRISTECGEGAPWRTAQDRMRDEEARR